MNITYFAHSGAEHGVTSTSHAETASGGQGTIFWAAIVTMAAVVLAAMVVWQLSKARKPVPQEQETEEE